MTTIQSFINEISPSLDEINQISISGNEIRGTIEGKLGFVVSSFLTGSYVRRTKISPIDDLDIFFKVNAGNTSIEWKNLEKKECKLYINTGFYNNHSLKDFAVYQDGKWYISPNMVLNEMKVKIKERYSATPDIKRRGEAITVYLSSYDLTIDCVPYIEVSGEEYLLIPTSGNDYLWKKTNPKTDKSEIDRLNDSAHFNGKLKGVIKLMKHWNANKNTGIKFRSYVLECWIYQILKNKTNYSDSYADLLKYVVREMYNELYFKITLDIPGYDYIYYPYTDDQWNRIKGLLAVLWKKLKLSEDDFISYLKS